MREIFNIQKLKDWSFFVKKNLTIDGGFFPSTSFIPFVDFSCRSQPGIKK